MPAPLSSPHPRIPRRLAHNMVRHPVASAVQRPGPAVRTPEALREQPEVRAMARMLKGLPVEVRTMGPTLRGPPPVRTREEVPPGKVQLVRMPRVPPGKVQLVRMPRVPPGKVQLVRMPRVLPGKGRLARTPEVRIRPRGNR